MTDTLYNINDTTSVELLKVLKEWDYILNNKIVPIENNKVPQILAEGWENEILKKYKSKK